MATQDLNYYRRRADEELIAADCADDPGIAQIHRELARRYRAMLSADDEVRNGNLRRVQPMGEAVDDRVALA